MESLSMIRDAVARFLIPSAKRRQSSRSTSPASKLATMQRPISPISETKGRKEKAVISGRVTKKIPTPSDSQKSVSMARNSQESEDEDEVEDEDEEEEDDEHSKDDASEYEISEIREETESEAMGPEDSASQIATRKQAAEPKSNDQQDSEEELGSDFEEELTAEAKVHQFLDHQAELARRQQALDAIKEGQWHPDEVALFQKLSLRGFEPLLPSHWKMDFRTVPAQLFSPIDEETFINAQCGTDFRATKALLSLFTLGCYVRSRSDCSKPEEPVIKKALENYLKWAAKDGDYTHRSYLPILIIVAAKVNQSLVDISAATTSRLTLLAQEHRRALTHPPPGLILENGEVEIFTRKPPVLYGVIIVRSVIVFVTLDSGNPKSKLRTLAHFDFSKKDMDVWNGFAVAILVCTVRNYLMGTSEKMDEVESEVEYDPDL